MSNDPYRPRPTVRVVVVELVVVVVVVVIDVLGKRPTIEIYKSYRLTAR